MIKFLITFLFIACDVHALLDLDSLHEPWVLETRQISIPGYPGAFNPSIVRWDDAYLMCFRTRDAATRVVNGIGFVWLDDDFNVISDPQKIDIAAMHPFSRSWPQDPRLIRIGDHLYMVYNDLVPLQQSFVSRMFISQLHMTERTISADNPSFILEFDGEQANRTEKNWVPFDYEGNLLLAYSLQPHHIFLPCLGSCYCDTVACTRAALKWKWGILRGGTPALKIGDQYVGFFHSVKDLVTVQSGGKRMVHYLMGAYTFSSEPPFELRSMSPSPIIDETFYNGPDYPTWKPLRAIFPCGFIADDHYIWVVYGRQDHEIWIVKMDRQALLESLVPVVTSE